MSEHEFAVGDYRATVFAILLRNGKFRAQVVIRRIGHKEPLHRTELYSVDFSSEADALAHGRQYADQWFSRIAHRPRTGSYR